MEDIISSILYGRLRVEIPSNLTLKQQLEIVRALFSNPSASQRIDLPKDIHPWVNLLLTQINSHNNGTV